MLGRVGTNALTALIRPAAEDGAASSASAAAAALVAGGAEECVQQQRGAQQRAAAAAWTYFEALRRAGLADVYHYTAILPLCADVASFKRLLGAMAAADITPTSATRRVVRKVANRLGVPLPAGESWAR